MPSSEDDDRARMRGARRRQAFERDYRRLEDEARTAEEHLEAWIPAWLKPGNPENRLPVAGAIAMAIVLQLAIPDKYGLHPRWLLPGLLHLCVHGPCR